MSMAPQKRKQPHDAAPKSIVQDAPARRSTRQHPDAGAEPEHRLRSGRARAAVATIATVATVATEKPSGAGTVVTRLASRGRKVATSAAAAAAAVATNSTNTAAATIQTTQTTQTIQTKATTLRHKGTAKPEPESEPTATAAVSPASKENVRPPTPPDNGRRRVVHAQPNQPPSQLQSQSQSRRRVHARSRSPPEPRQSRPRLSSPSQSRVLAPRSPQQPARPVPVPVVSGSGSALGPAPAAGAGVGVGIVTVTPKHTRTLPPSSTSKTPKPPGTPHSDRNIDKIVFGNTSFKAWYPSYYGKEVLGDVSAGVGGGGGGGNAKIGGGKRDIPILDHLYVCPCCFKYSNEMVPWWKHVQYCEKKAFVPGTKIYTHPYHSKPVSKSNTSSVATSPTSTAKGKEKSRPNHSDQPAASVAIVSEGEWSVWEVDGEKDGLFCQNLSLFAKLFLDNKSVFFDVTGFNYFLLVYTPPLSETHPTSPTQAGSAPEPPTKSENFESTTSNPQASSASTSPPPRPRPQIVGFFSKEKMSWDNNNLACILVFPPWQRKGLGALLMGVSYEISRREGILGGPEKPISELGRKGYKRFWAGEITRWILELDLPPPSTESAPTARPTRREKEREKDRGKDKAKEQEGLVVNVEQCSRDTWIVPEDCLAVLREMGVVEEAGLGPPRAERDANKDGGTDANTHGKEKEDKESKPPLVPRIRIDKAAVRHWARENDIDLTKACDPDGFVEGYAIKQVEDDDQEE